MASHAKNFEPAMPSEQDAHLAKLSSRVLAPHVADREGLRIHLEDGTEAVLPAAALRLMGY